VSDHRETSNFVDDVFSSSGVRSGDEQLREKNSLWWLPLLSLPNLPSLGVLIHIVVEDSFLLSRGFGLNIRQRSLSAFEVLVKLLSILSLEQSSKTPCETVNPKSLEGEFVDLFSLPSLETGSEEVESLVNPDYRWTVHDVVVVFLQDIKKVKLLKILLTKVFAPG
jgi:hypothetical protein